MTPDVVWRDPGLLRPPTGSGAQAVRSVASDDVHRVPDADADREASIASARRLRPRDPMLALARCYLAEQLDALQDLTLKIRDAHSPEVVHQMRVAMRRIRAALKAFGPVFPQQPAMQLRREFRWLAQGLGRVRDLDVYRARVHQQIATLTAEQAQALEPYEAHLDREHRQAREAMLIALESARCRRLMNDFDGFVHRDPSPAARRRWGSLRVCDGAPVYVDAAYRRVRKRGRRISVESAPRELHELRIRAKRLRYLLEIFAPVYGKGLRNCIKACRRLQDLLGEHQDACVATTQLQAYAESLVPGRRTTAQLLALGSLMHLQAERAAVARERFGADWQRFEDRCRRSKLRALLAAGRDH